MGKDQTCSRDDVFGKVTNPSETETDEFADMMRFQGSGFRVQGSGGGSPQPRVRQGLALSD